MLRQCSAVFKGADRLLERLEALRLFPRNNLLEKKKGAVRLDGAIVGAEKGVDAFENFVFNAKRALLAIRLAELLGLIVLLIGAEKHVGQGRSKSDCGPEMRIVDENGKCQTGVELGIVAV